MVVTVVLAALNLAAFALLMLKIKDGATAGLSLWLMGAVPVLAVLAAVFGRTSSAAAASAR